MKKYNINNYILYIGCTSDDNWKILSTSKSWHIFIHLSKFPSCYGILNTDINTIIDKQILIKCCRIVLDNTKFKNIKNIKFDITSCNNVRKGDFIGEVIYKSKSKIQTMLI